MIIAGVGGTGAGLPYRGPVAWPPLSDLGPLMCRGGVACARVALPARGCPVRLSSSAACATGCLVITIGGALDGDPLDDHTFVRVSVQRLR